jgi:predicted ATPase
MAFTRIHVSNFKSLKDIEINLGRFNVLVGQNASGKSNIISIFRFLRDIKKYGLDNAISMQGGTEYLRNLTLGKSEKTSFKVVFDKKLQLFTDPEKKTRARVNKTTYSFALGYTARGFKILEDYIKFECDFFRKTGSAKPEKCGEGEVVISNELGKIKVLIKPREGTIPMAEDDILPPAFYPKLPKTALLMSAPLLTVMGLFEEVFGEISIYDFDPKLAKKATPVTGKVELEEDGNNLALVLKKIVNNKKSKERLLDLLKDSLSFVTTVNVEKYADKSFLFNVRESYNTGRAIPASLTSDGTISITAIILALYFERRHRLGSKEETLTIIEEPERNIHPQLISKVVAMMKDVSEKKQVIVTTHNPEVVRNAGIEDLIFVFRDQGFTNISRPSESEQVQLFLREELGIDEIFRLNLLENKQ